MPSPKRGTANPSASEPTSPSQRETTALMEAALHRKYARPGWALTLRVSSRTGFNPERVIDAIAIGCYPSTDFHILGFEIKASRSDWLRELKNMGKSDVFFRACHSFLLVTPPDVVKAGELPAAWGHLIFKGGVLHVATKAPIRTPDPLPPELLASWLRTTGSSDEGHLAEQLALARAEGQAEGREQMKVSLERDRALLEHANRKLEQVCEVTGLDLHNLRFNDAPAPLLRLLNGRNLQSIEQLLDRLLSNARDLTRHAEQVLSEFDAAEVKRPDPSRTNKAKNAARTNPRTRIDLNPTWAPLISPAVPAAPDTDLHQHPETLPTPE